MFAHYARNHGAINFQSFRKRVLTQSKIIFHLISFIFVQYTHVQYVIRLCVSQNSNSQNSFSGWKATGKLGAVVQMFSWNCKGILKIKIIMKFLWRIFSLKGSRRSVNKCTKKLKLHRYNNHCVKNVQIRSFFLIRIFLFSDWIQGNTDQI